jgi:hypothetical protein
MIKDRSNKSNASSQFAASRSILHRAPTEKKGDLGQSVSIENYFGGSQGSQSNPFASAHATKSRDNPPRKSFRRADTTGKQPTRRIRYNYGSNLLPAEAQTSQSLPVDATVGGTTSSVALRPGSAGTSGINNQQDIQSNVFQTTRRAPIDATSLGANPTDPTQVVIQNLGKKFRNARRSGGIGTTERESHGNSSRERGNRPPSKWNRDKNDEASDRPRRGGSDSQNGRIDHSLDVSPEEEEYKKTMEEIKRGSPVAYNPEQPTLESLSGLGPALAVNTHGMSEIVIERLRRMELIRERAVQEVEVLARMKVAERTPRFVSKEQEELTMKRVEQILKMQHSHGPDQEAGKEGEKVASGENELDIPQEKKDALLHHLLSGSYHLARPAVEDGRDIIGHVARLANSNGSYRPKDEEALLRKIHTLLPAARRTSQGVSQAESAGLA